MGFSIQYLYLLFGLSNPEIKNCPILGLLHSCFNSASLSLLQSCLHEKIRIVVQTFRIRFRGAAAAHAPKPGKTPIMSAQSRCRLLFFKIKVRPRSCRSYPIRSPCSYIQILCRFQKCKQKVPSPSLLSSVMKNHPLPQQERFFSSSIRVIFHKIWI